MDMQPNAPVRNLVRALSRSVPGRRLRKGGRRAHEDGWRVYLIHTRTGQVGPAIDPSAGSWEITLNATETMSVTVQKQDLAGIERKWYTPYWGGLLFTWSRDGVEAPILAGPVTEWSGETDTTLSLGAVGLRGLFSSLLVDGAKGLHVTDRSLGHIMWLLAAQAQGKPGGGLPIYDATPDPDGRGHARNYESWNLANNDLDKLMKELSEVIGGPDVMLRPEWADDDHRFVRWGVHHGTSVSPRIQSGRQMDFDTTAPRSPVATVQVSTTAQSLASRVWATGSGEGAGTVIAQAQDLTLVSEGFPFSEAVVSDTSTNADGAAVDAQPTAAALQQKAEGELAARVDAVDQITVTVRADHPLHGIDRFAVGDPAVVTLAGWLSVPDGGHWTRIIKAGGDLSETVKLDFQSDTWI